MRRDSSAVSAAITVDSVVSAYDDSTVMDNHISAEVLKRSAAEIVRSEEDRIQNTRVQSLQSEHLLSGTRAAFGSGKILTSHRRDADRGCRP